LIAALVGVEWWASLSSRFNLGTHWIGGWLESRTGLDDMEKWKFLTLPVLELRPICRPEYYNIRFLMSETVALQTLCTQTAIMLTLLLKAIVCFLGSVDNAAN
jgi:hypothetical protein